MKKNVLKIYYTALIVALVTILVSGVIINRSLVNIPEFYSDAENKKAPAYAYMLYIDEEDEPVIATAKQGDKEFDNITNFINQITVLKTIDKNSSKNKIPDAWIVLYDEDNNIVDRINFYDRGKTLLRDSTEYKIDTMYIQSLKDIIDQNIESDFANID